MTPKFLILSTIVLAMTSPALAADFEFPARKPGQWQIVMTPEKPAGMPSMTVEACIDAATDKAMMSAGLAMNKDLCERLDIANDGGAIILDSTCQLGPMKATTHIVVEGDFNSAYTVKITGKTEGGPMDGDMAMSQTATWMADACTGDLKPGEMLMPGGMKIDATRMMQGMGG